ncbi:hypothetical protein NEAUS04_2388 [Nematocida ausubeli]|nr:hypothetical protein NEAUS05_2449 [Nematocida ausubeli]KAI5164950.1 hypothetical protein NEAUS04_2388 [Nematocida ausubeli]
MISERKRNKGSTKKIEIIAKSALGVLVLGLYACAIIPPNPDMLHEEPLSIQGEVVGCPERRTVCEDRLPNSKQADMGPGLNTSAVQLDSCFADSHVFVQNTRIVSKEKKGLLNAALYKMKIAEKECEKEAKRLEELECTVSSARTLFFQSRKKLKALKKKCAESNTAYDLAYKEADAQYSKIDTCYKLLNVPEVPGGIDDAYNAKVNKVTALCKETIECAECEKTKRSTSAKCLGSAKEQEKRNACPRDNLMICLAQVLDAERELYRTIKCNLAMFGKIYFKEELLHEVRSREIEYFENTGYKTTRLEEIVELHRKHLKCSKKRNDALACVYSCQKDIVSETDRLCNAYIAYEKGKSAHEEQKRVFSAVKSLLYKEKEELDGHIQMLQQEE